MPLTPTDVANKQFKIAFRGYSLDEVDAFLDEVETELSRLLRDNAGAADRPVPAASASLAAPSGPSAPSPGAGLEGQEAPLRTLLLAQRTADEAVAEARAEAQQIVLDARTESETALASARSEADKTLHDAKAEATSTLDSARAEAQTTLTRARTEATTTLGAARKEAETTLGAAQTKAAGLDEDIAGRIKAATGDLDERRRSLEARIEELHAFEREYRTRLKAYLETQLRDLDGAGSEDGGAGVPAGARSSAVGLTPGAAAGVGPRPEAAAAPADKPAAQPAGQAQPADKAGSPVGPPAAEDGPEPVGPFRPASSTQPPTRP